MESVEGLRFNTGKIRYDLLEPYALEQQARIMTKGASKYADRNWEKGMKWSKCIASMKRHIAAFESGQDRDVDPNCEACKKGDCTNHTGELHIAQAAWNANAITSYYKLFPQGDDRAHSYLHQPKIGLDIDEVLCDWLGGYKEKYGYAPDHEFTSWDVHYDIVRRLNEEMGNVFYLKLKPKFPASELRFEPHCYITARHIPQEITEQWLYMNGFPCKKVYTVGNGVSKVDAAKEAGIDIYIDDSYKNFVELNKAGICCYLLDASHNRSYEVGYKRIKHVNDVL